MSDKPIFNHTLHKEMWNWLANNPRYKKEDWPEWKFNGGTLGQVLVNCFACETTRNITGTEHGNCCFCPLDWKAVSNYDHCCVLADNANQGLWYKYDVLLNQVLPRKTGHAQKDEHKAIHASIVQLARAIRDVPLNMRVIEECGVEVI